MTNEKMREEFEKWAIKELIEHDFLLKLNDPQSMLRKIYGFYKHKWIEFSWKSWQASRENLNKLDNKLHNKKFIATKDFNKYLESNGWYINSTIPEIANIWQSNVYKNEEILQPINYDLLDFELRVNDLIQVLSRIQQKSKEEIINEINNYMYCQQN